jgi:hypothetical protein
MREIDYDQILVNIKTMINTLEYDSMRSAGKCKINAGTLETLINLKKHYAPKDKQPNTKKEA